MPLGTKEDITFYLNVRCRKLQYVGTKEHAAFFLDINLICVKLGER
jgi:hypothetical protein